MTFLLRVDPATPVNPFAGEHARDLDGATLEDCWDGRWAGVAFSVACYDTSAFEQQPCVAVLVTLDDGCDTHDPVTELVDFTLGRWGELVVTGSGGDPAAATYDDAPRVPWVWLADPVRAWVWQFAADWWINGACQSAASRPRARRRARRAARRGGR